MFFHVAEGELDDFDAFAAEPGGRGAVAPHLQTREEGVGHFRVDWRANGIKCPHFAVLMHDACKHGKNRHIWVKMCYYKKCVKFSCIYRYLKNSSASERLCPQTPTWAPPLDPL